MSMRRKSCALAVAAGVILVSGGCGRDVLAPQARPGDAPTVQVIVPARVATEGPALIVVDGVEQEAAPGRLTRLDPVDIRSVEVLKGPAATRIYGTKARGGAIVITTKRGAGQ
jgi:TonB-dependent SusC/RagA subfamily outer membrane receptor